VAGITYISLGSNIGDAYKNCVESIRRVAGDERVEVLAVSSLFRTSPVSPVPQPDFLNGAVKIKWNSSPHELLGFLQGIEQTMGRQRTVPLGPRTIDLDILLFDALLLDTPDLTLPHPRLHERRFMLLPCIEMSPDLVHPRLAIPLVELLKETDTGQKIELFKRISKNEIFTGPSVTLFCDAQPSTGQWKRKEGDKGERS
jgi:2-amino-4-hydroxy-6-hydroxymethyldihydropteridine diphosphokinase